ncbi:ubiquitin-related modifier 1 [Caerostris extrusa]|uniref:Ubiquitin-related modifier 1 homolog n=1 Tax=Caerostris extrusa TaxID=172846 RepID=A0AAV4RL72_CAEEX|nr:ubiquitin-related modifier 1 [Caerostris extrusa]
MEVTIKFSGGLELLFKNQKEHLVELPESNEKWTIKSLIIWIRENLLQERPELFIEGESVRPGILVLVNDSDWELVGDLGYEVQSTDTIVFISTLHGALVHKTSIAMLISSSTIYCHPHSSLRAKFTCRYKQPTTKTLTSGAVTCLLD